MALYCKVDCMLDSHPKIRKAGRAGREVFLFLLRRHRALDGQGSLSADNLDPAYMADQLMMPIDECVTACHACVTAKLITVTGENVTILGWSEEWSREAKTPAERKADQRRRERENKAPQTEPCHEMSRMERDSHVREEKRREEKKRDLFTPSTPGEAEPAEPKAKKAVKRALPDDWEPNAKHAAKAKELGLQLGKCAEEFRYHWGARGDTMKNWDLAFFKWLLNAVKFAARSGNGFQRPAEQKRHIPVFAFKTDAPDPIDEMIKAL